MGTAPLTGKQKRYLRSLGHHLQPVVQVGKEGLTDGVFEAVDGALERHELIKIKRGSECPADRHEVGETIATHTRAHLVQTLGQTVLLYRRRKEKPEIELPKGA